MSRVVRPPPRVNVGGSSAGLPHAPPPRIDYLQARYEADGLPPVNSHGSSSSSSNPLPAPEPTPPPVASPTPGQESSFDFDADVQREMARLENELRKQLEQEEQLMARNAQASNAAQDSHFPDIPLRNSYDRQMKQNPTPSPSRRQEPMISVVAPEHPPAPSNAPVQTAVKQPKLSFEEWMAINYPEETSKESSSKSDASYQAPNYAAHYQPNDMNFPRGTRDGRDHQTRLDLQQSQLQSQQYSRYGAGYGKGAAISNLFEVDPSRAAKEKISRQSEYRKELELQIESRNRRDDQKSLNRQESIEYLQKVKPYEETYEQRRSATSPQHHHSYKERDYDRRPHEISPQRQREVQPILSYEEEQRLRKRKEQEEYRKLLEQQVEENKRLQPRKVEEYDEFHEGRYHRQNTKSSQRQQQVPLAAAASAEVTPSRSNIKTGVDSDAISPRKMYAGRGKQPLQVDTAAAEQQLGAVNTSPNLKAARQRLITDVYGSSGLTMGAGGGTDSSSYRITPSHRQGAPSKESMEENKRILQMQIDEARARKQEEKERERLNDEADERRVRMELANLERDEQRNMELSRAIAEENHQKVAELQRQKAAHDALARKGLHSSNPTAPRVSPKKVLPVPGDSNWGGPMNVRPVNVQASSELNTQKQEMAQMHLQENHFSSSDARQSFDMQHQQQPQVRPPPKVRPPQPTSAIDNSSMMDQPYYSSQGPYNPQQLNNLTPQYNRYSYESDYSAPSKNYGGGGAYREKDRIDGFAPVPLRGRGGIDASIDMSVANEYDPDYALMSWQRKHGFNTKRGNTPNTGQVRSSVLSVMSDNRGIRDSYDPHEASFVSESKLISDSRLIPGDKSVQDSYNLLNNSGNMNSNDRVGSKPDLPPVEQSMTSDSLLLYLGQRTPTQTPRGAAVSKSMAIHSNSPSKIGADDSQNELKVVRPLSRGPVASYDTYPLDEDSYDPYRSIDRGNNSTTGSKEMKIYTPSREERLALDRSVGKSITYEDESFEVDQHPGISPGLKKPPKVETNDPSEPSSKPSFGGIDSKYNGQHISRGHFLKDTDAVDEVIDDYEDDFN